MRLLRNVGVTLARSRVAAICTGPTHRRLMQSRFDRTAYRDRVQVETAVSMVKCRLASFVRARTAWSQRREIRLKVLRHKIVILLSV